MLLREQCHRTLFTIQLFGVKSLWRNSLCFGRHRGATFVTLGNGRPHCPSTFCFHWIMRNMVLFTWFWSNVKHSQHSPGLGRTIRQIIRTESQTAGDTSSDSPWPLEDVVIHWEPQRISVGSCRHGLWVFFPFVNLKWSFAKMLSFSYNDDVDHTFTLAFSYWVYIFSLLFIWP